MPVSVLIPGALRGEIDGASRLTVESTGSLDAVLREIVARWPRLGRRLCDERGEIRKFVNVYVDGEDVRRCAGVNTPVADGAEVQVIPSVAGGC